MRLKTTFSRAADIDLSELVAYIGKESPQAAVQVSQRILKKIDMLQEHPLIGRPGQRTGSRELVDGTPYIVAYRVDLERRRVFVLRIVHHAQRWPVKV